MLKKPLSEIEYFAYNLTDASGITGRDGIALNLTIAGKSGQKHIDPDRIDVNLIVMHPERDLDPGIDPKKHLFSTCQILSERFKIRTYYKTIKGRKFRQFTPKQLKNKGTN